MLLLCWVVLGAEPSADADSTYYIASVEDIPYLDTCFCDNGPCPCTKHLTASDAVSSLEQAMQAAGWTGSRYVNAGVIPQHFLEMCYSGMSGVDAYYADAANLVVFNGHGDPGTLYIGASGNYPQLPDLPGLSAFSLDDHARLGWLSGGKAAFGLWLACDVLENRTHFYSNPQWLTQQAGFTRADDEPPSSTGYDGTFNIDDDEPRDFFNLTAFESNVDAWIGIMNTCMLGALPPTYAVPCVMRQPIVVTFSPISQADALAKHNSLAMKRDGGTPPMPRNPSACGQEPHPDLYYAYTYLPSWLDHTGEEWPQTIPGQPPTGSGFVGGFARPMRTGR